MTMKTNTEDEEILFPAGVGLEGGDAGGPVEGVGREVDGLLGERAEGLEGGGLVEVGSGGPQSNLFFNHCLSGPSSPSHLRQAAPRPRPHWRRATAGPPFWPRPANQQRKPHSPVRTRDLAPGLHRL